MHAAAENRWRPTSHDFERFLTLREREQHGGTPLSADERAFVGQFVDFSVDAVPFDSGTAKKALKNAIKTGVVDEESLAILEAASFKVPALEKNPKLSALVERLVKEGVASTGDIQEVFALTGKLGFREDRVVQPAFEALACAKVLTDDQVKLIEDWLKTKLTECKFYI
jgi:hypothetical protein